MKKIQINIVLIMVLLITCLTYASATQYVIEIDQSKNIGKLLKTYKITTENALREVDPEKTTRIVTSNAEVYEQIRDLYKKHRKFITFSFIDNDLKYEIPIQD